MQRVSLHSDFTWTRSDAPGKSRSKSVDITRVTTIRLLGIAHYPLKATCITGIIQFHLLSNKAEEQNTEMFFLSHWSVFSLCVHLFKFYSQLSPLTKKHAYFPLPYWYCMHIMQKQINQQFQYYRPLSWGSTALKNIYNLYIYFFSEAKYLSIAAMINQPPLTVSQICVAWSGNVGTKCIIWHEGTLPNLSITVQWVNIHEIPEMFKSWRHLKNVWTTLYIILKVC